jgi:uncharacterized membrane protein (UPF0182 family)
MINRPTRSRPPAPRRSQRRWIIVGAVVFVLLVSLGSLVTFYTDLLWFREVGFAPVFLTILWTRFGVGIAGGLAAGIFVFANLELARRTAPRYRFATTGTDVAEQYRTLFRPYARWLNLGMAAVIGLLTGLSTSTAWERFLLWRNAQPFGVRDAQFGRDVSFFVFSIPFQRTVLSLFFGIIVVTIIVALVAHLLNGTIEPEANRVRVQPIVKVHVSVLFGLWALLKAWAYRLDQFDLVYSPRGRVTGASYTDVNAQLPALRVLMVIAVVAAVIFFVNLRFRGWMLPVAALGLWAFSSLLLGALIPSVVQRFVVAPNEPQREAPYIERNIEATRRAFGLADIDVRGFGANDTLDQATVDANLGTIENVRIWDPDVLLPTYQRLQSIRTYYNFTDVDIDRYTIDGRMRQILLSAREVDPTRLAENARNWANERLVYTHGYGYVASPANAVTPEGLPENLVRNLPPEGPEGLLPERQGVYYGENVPDYAVVSTGLQEIDYPRGGEELVRTTYDGEGGVPISNLLSRVAFSWKFGDTDLLISNFIRPSSKVLMNRNIKERAQAAAPFLMYDRDPYLVAGEEGLYWMLDAYTATDRYPYSDRLSLGTIFGASHPVRVNYMRNSVKVVVDAYHGTMNFYVVDPEDPLVATYQAAFPELFTPGEEMSDEIRAHQRYPEDLFTVQAHQYRLYHMTNPQTFYNAEDAWDIPRDPVNSTEASVIPMEPYYVVMKVPGEQTEEFILMSPFTPRGRPNLNGWMAARSDPEHYGKLVAFEFPRGRQIEGPENIGARIEQNPAISQQFTFWEGAGSRVDRGNMFVLPIGESLIYVQPIYLTSAQAEQALPELRRVIVVIGDKIGFEANFEASLQQAMAGAGPVAVDPSQERPPPTDGEAEATPAPPPPAGDIGSLLQQAAEHFARADEALRAGDLATYQRENQAARQAVEEARRQSGGG